MNIIQILSEKKLTISTAESLTGGMIASKICNISGASNYFKGGIVSYTKETKCSLLGLKMEDIIQYGVYSEKTVIAMAKGVKEKTQSDLAIATSGVAGPNADEGIPAGVVYFCFIISKEIYTECVQLNGNRNEVREQAAEYAIHRVIELLK